VSLGVLASGLGTIREGPSMHEMEGPYPISQRQTPLAHAQRLCRSIHQAGHPPEVPVTQFL